ncbi:hypothetical protein CAPTEDRAFT_218920 [Capitella teleta]|uniref:U3 small nucleolar RNA-associated protein 13 C-terminal domain-containing protein n=1 Tax=Capitella teleta TaxID=283909 RepID=R7V299_CAPTE|nr:hypothetical protein CAPTEDRAFT_218920 [Capitella teleta]|eukprot:ELU12607.1 hypothetical protein CAPTEDRAFT_218920 [Capitella teleta]
MSVSNNSNHILSCSELSAKGEPATIACFYQSATQSWQSLILKWRLSRSFAVDAKHEAFFTGGKVQVSQNEKHIFTQCSNKVIALDVATGLSSHEISQILVVAHQNLILRQWLWKEKELVRSWKAIHISPVSCMTFDPTSTLLATGGCDATIKVWDVLKKYCTHNLKGHQGVISLAEFHPNAELLQLVTAADDSCLRVWSLESSSCLYVLEGHFSAIPCIQFSVDGNTLYSAGRDNVIITWDLIEKKKRRVIPTFESIEGLALLPSTKRGYPELAAPPNKEVLVSGGLRGELRVWDPETGLCLKGSTAEGSSENTSQSIVRVSLTQSLLTAVTFDHNILQYERNTLKPQRQLVGNNDDVVDMKFFGEMHSHLVVATNSELIKVYEVSTWVCQILRGHSDTVMALDVSSDGHVLVSASKDQTARVWKMDAEGAVQCVGIAKGHTHAVLSVGVSRLKPSLLVTGSHDLTLKTWPLSTAVDSDDITALSTTRTTKAHDKEINSLVLSPNDKFIASGSQDRTAKLWTASDLSLVGVFRGHRRGIWRIQFSPVDQCVATASADGTIRIWSLTDFSCVKMFEGHEGSVLTVQFLCRGMQLLSSGSDGLVKLWTIKSTECVKTFDNHEGKVWALALNSAEDRIATGASDASIMLWKDVSEIEVQEARAQQKELITRKQKLDNLIQQKKYLKAIGLAIVLDQPFRLMTIIKLIMESDEAEKLQETLTALRDDQIGSLLKYMVQWNSNSKHCHVAQTVLSVILRSFTPETLLTLPNMRSSLEGLLPYTERHYERLGRLAQQTTFIDYTWCCMRRVGTEQIHIDAESPPILSEKSKLKKGKKKGRKLSENGNEAVRSKRRKSAVK